MWRLPSRPHQPLRDGAVLEGWCITCGALRALPEQVLSRAVRVDLPRDFDVHRHCLVACATCGTPYLVDTWYALPRAPWREEDASFQGTLDAVGGAMNSLGDAVGRGATKAADAMENGVRWAMGHKPIDRRDARAQGPETASSGAARSSADEELDAYLRRDSSLLEDSIEAKFRALEEAERKKRG